MLELTEREQKMMETMLKQMEYRRKYNATHKDEQRAYRQAYNKKRWSEMKELKAKIAAHANE